MKKTLLKRLAAFLALCMMFPAAADATQEKIDQVQDEIQRRPRRKRTAFLRRLAAWKETLPHSMIS